MTAVAPSVADVVSLTSATSPRGPVIAAAAIVRIAGAIRLLVVVCLPIAADGCLDAPPDPSEDGVLPDGSPVSACGNSRLDIAYMSRFAVDPDGYGRAGLNLVAVVINSGAGPLDVTALEVLQTSIDDDQSVLSFGAYDRGDSPIEPGEAHGQLSSNGRDMVMSHVLESWTDPNAPELSGMLTTSRDHGQLHGSVLIALGPHHVTLDMEFDLTSFQGSGAFPQSASRTASICADGT